MGFIALIRRELVNAFLHDARRAIFLFGAATAYLILFGILYYPGVVKEIPTVVCDEEHTAYSRLLTRQVDDDERLGLVRVVADEGEARDMLRRKEVYAAVIIPADFSHDILNGRSAKVLFMLNGANIITTNIATTAGNDIVNTFNTRFAARQAALRTSGDEQMLKKRISPVETTLRVLDNPTQSYMMFFVTGLAMAAMQQGFFLAIGAAVQCDFRNPELKGTSKGRLLVVKVGVYWGLSILWSVSWPACWASLTGRPSSRWAFWPVPSLLLPFPWASSRHPFSTTNCSSSGRPSCTPCRPSSSAAIRGPWKPWTQ